ncbi:MAG: thioredoxin-dependent thiol peroxidase [Sphingobium sp.]
MLETENNVPQIALTDADGAIFTLAEYRGKRIVVYFYPKADTPGCTNEAKDFTELAGDFDQANVPVIAVSKDKPTKLAKFRDKYALKLRLASDESGAFCEAFGTWIEKSLYGRKYMGIARATFLIDGDGMIRRVWPAVKVKGHADEVLKVLMEQ